VLAVGERGERNGANCPRSYSDRAKAAACGFGRVGLFACESDLASFSFFFPELLMLGCLLRRGSSCFNNNNTSQCNPAYAEFGWGSTCLFFEIPERGKD